MGDAVEAPVVPMLTADHRFKRPVNFRKHRKGDRQWRTRLLAVALGISLLGGLGFWEGRYLVSYWQMRQAVKGGHMAQAEKIHLQFRGWWAPIKPRGEAAYEKLFARRAAYFSYLKAIDAYQMESDRLEKKWQALRAGLMRGQVTDEELLGRLEEIVRANHQLVQDLPKPESLLHASDVAVHQNWVTALRLKEQGLTQLWYAFHLHDPGKVTAANQLMQQARDADVRYEEGMRELKAQLGQP